MTDERARLVEELEQLRARVEEIGQRLAELDRSPVDRVRLRIIKGGAAALAGFLALVVWSRRHPVTLAASAGALLAVSALAVLPEGNEGRTRPWGLQPLPSVPSSVRPGPFTSVPGSTPTQPTPTPTRSSFVSGSTVESFAAEATSATWATPTRESTSAPSTSEGSSGVVPAPGGGSSPETEPSTGSPDAPRPDEPASTRCRGVRLHVEVRETIRVDKCLPRDLRKHRIAENTL